MTDPKTSPGPASESPASESPASESEESRAEGAEAGSDLSEEAYAETLAKLHKMSAPHKFADSVEEAIRRRSAGRFFGRKAFGDRVPLELLAVIALVIGFAVFLLLRASQTGSLRYQKPAEKPAIAPGARDVVPQPAPVDK
jgi:hypothetical protein